MKQGMQRVCMPYTSVCGEGRGMYVVIISVCFHCPGTYTKEVTSKNLFR